MYVWFSQFLKKKLQDKKVGNKMNSGLIGEYHTLCELWRNSINALQATDPTQKDWDILILNRDSTSIEEKLQVKTLNWNNDASKVITGNWQGEYDYLVITVINYCNEVPYLSFYVPKKKVRERPREQKQGLLDSSNNLLFCNRTITLNSLPKLKEKLEKLYGFSQLNGFS